MCVCTFVQCHRLSGGLTKLIEASEQLSVLNEKLEVQKEAVTKKTAACEELLSDISSKTEQAKEKQQMAQAKSIEIEEQNKVIAVEKVLYLNICYCKLKFTSTHELFAYLHYSYFLFMHFYHTLHYRQKLRKHWLLLFQLWRRLELLLVILTNLMLQKSGKNLQIHTLCTSVHL